MGRTGAGTGEGEGEGEPPTRVPQKRIRRPRKPGHFCNRPTSVTRHRLPWSPWWVHSPPPCIAAQPATYRRRRGVGARVGARAGPGTGPGTDARHRRVFATFSHLTTEAGRDEPGTSLSPRESSRPRHPGELEKERVVTCTAFITEGTTSIVRKKEMCLRVHLPRFFSSVH
jgi:hypothetical protein